MGNLIKQIEEAMKEQLVAVLEDKEENGAEKVGRRTIGVDISEVLNGSGRLERTYGGRFFGNRIYADVKITQPAGKEFSFYIHSSAGETVARYGLTIPFDISIDINTEGGLCTSYIAGYIQCEPHARVEGHVEIGF